MKYFLTFVSNFRREKKADKIKFCLNSWLSTIWTRRWRMKYCVKSLNDEQLLVELEQVGKISTLILIPNRWIRRPLISNIRSKRGTWTKITILYPCFMSACSWEPDQLRMISASGLAHYCDVIRFSRRCTCLRLKSYKFPEGLLRSESLMFHSFKSTEYNKHEYRYIKNVDGSNKVKSIIEPHGPPTFLGKNLTKFKKKLKNFKK